MARQTSIVDIDSIRSRKYSDWTIIKRLLAYLGPHLIKFIPITIFLVLLVGLDLIGPLLLARVLDLLGKDPIDIAGILWISLGYVGIMAVNALLAYQQTMLLQGMGQKVIYSIRKDVFEHIETLSISQFNKVPIGKLVTRVTSDTSTLNTMYTDVLVNLFRNSLTIVGAFITMFIMQATLSLYISAVVPFVVIASIVFRKFTRRAYRNVRTQVSIINAFLSEHLSGMKLIQIFNREPKKWTNSRKRAGSSQVPADADEHLRDLPAPSLYFLYVCALLIALWFGGKMAIQGIITFGILYAFTDYIHKFFDPIQELAEQFDTMQAAFTSGERIFEILDTKPEVVDQSDAKPIVFQGKIEFKNVWFAYIGDDWILKDVSFVVNPRETVAFVGATGSGKTTILSLIVRNFDIQKGQILIDGVDIKSIEIGSLRKQVGQMLQDVFLFAGTIESNIRLGDESITDADIVEAAKYVNADRFIDRLPEKYQRTGPRTRDNFSSGQRQLLSFARTIVHRPSVMILDEATANIDTETEMLIQESLTKMMNIGTMIIVAHRLSTIQHVDKIIVMQKGRIIELGNHQELLRRKGHYYMLYQLQYDHKMDNV
ncbi:MAG: ABC transporter ATP-binding protein/permease [Bacillus subtilis]|nr:ABC transporter ATP-binding protein/permease [Bacillus subtilis]